MHSGFYSNNPQRGLPDHPLWINWLPSPYLWLLYNITLICLYGICFQQNCFVYCLLLSPLASLRSLFKCCFYREASMTTQAKECPSPFSIYFTTQFYYNYYFLELVITWYVCAYTHAHVYLHTLTHTLAHTQPAETLAAFHIYSMATCSLHSLWEGTTAEPPPPPRLPNALLAPPALPPYRALQPF